MFVGGFFLNDFLKSKSNLTYFQKKKDPKCDAYI